MSKIKTIIMNETMKRFFEFFAAVVAGAIVSKFLKLSIDAAKNPLYGVMISIDITAAIVVVTIYFFLVYLPQNYKKRNKVI